jgi:periplasmic protein TonB
MSLHRNLAVVCPCFAIFVVLSPSSYVYPALARAAHIAGTVRLSVVVGTDGKVTRLSTISGPPMLAQAAQDAVKQWEYSPRVVGGNAVPATLEVSLEMKP